MNKSRITLSAFVLLAGLGMPSAGLVGMRPAAASTGVAPLHPVEPSGALPGALSGDNPPVDQSWESVSVTGTGEVFGAPDMLTANFAVETSAATVDAALRGANTAATRMHDALLQAGIVQTDLQTSEVGVSPQRDDHQAITGYTVTQGVTAKIRDLPRAGAVMSAAIAAGGDAARLNGVTFTIEDDAALLAEARKKAFADARGKAELYAREAGRPLGRVVRVSEETPKHWEPVAYHSMTADAAVPIEPGRQLVSVTITVEWAFQSTPAQP